MSGKNTTIKSITLSYFSGTGCTEAIVECFEKQLIEHGIDVSKINVACLEEACKKVNSDLLIIFSPVYALRLTSIVEEWTKKLPETENMAAAIISVSGAGEMSPNTACRVKCKSILKKKGYNFIYEKMLVMPSNFAIQAEQQLNFRVINIMPLKVKTIIADILSGKKNITQPKIQDRFLAVMGKMEHLGARFFGRFIKVSKACNQCSACVRNCPKKNIQIKNGKIKFGFGCMLCLKCIYACPCKALSPRILRFFVLKSGFNLKSMSDDAYKYVDDKGNKPVPSVWWSGVTDYLDE